MRLLLITPSYPRGGVPYSGGFIHRRVVQYAKYHHECRVVVTNRRVTRRGESEEYTYEGVQVSVVPEYELSALTARYKPDCILIHFLGHQLMRNDVLRQDIPILVWIHGVEALAWHRRLFDLNLGLTFLKYMLNNIWQRAALKRFVENARNRNICFVFPSNWMKEITERDNRCEISSYAIIPNPVDSTLFAFHEKSAEHRKNILILRPFTSKKYGTDIAVKTILELAKRDIFSDLHFTIYGQGKYFGRQTLCLSAYNNVELHERLLPQTQIPMLHRHNGILLCPTRQDSQGVSMCEAMSSGLVPVSSPNSAIPEFVIDGKTGLLARTPKEFADRIEYLFFNPQVFTELSRNAAKNITLLAGVENVIEKELQLIKSGLASDLEVEL